MFLVVNMQKVWYGVSNWLEGFREVAELTLKVCFTCVWKANHVVFLRKIYVFDCEHAESVIGVWNSFEGFCEVAELIIKVYLSMETRIVGFPTEIYVFGGEHQNVR